MEAIVSEGNLAIRLMLDEDAEYERIARWRNEPHVSEWWDPDDPPLTPDAARKEFGPLTSSDSSDTACIVMFDDRAAGYIQFYPWAAFRDEAASMNFPQVDDAWGLDVFIGEPDLIGRGVGSAAVDLVCRYLFDQRGASRVMLAAAVDNAIALRSYGKAGFARAGRVLDTDMHGGERVESWLMVRRAPRRQGSPVMSRDLAETTHLLPLDEDASTLKP
jgi:aminoglycoside 6'-N-acetyltransferase